MAIENSGTPDYDTLAKLRVKLQLTSPKCKVRIKGSLTDRPLGQGEELVAAERLNALSVLQVMQSIAIEKGCDLSTDLNSEYEIEAKYLAEYSGNGQMQQQRSKYFSIEMHDTHSGSIVYQKLSGMNNSMGLFSSDLQINFKRDRMILK